ncbi:hypothetical protein AAF712_003510 [Marasmius tenuissimus]|uniref:EthD domain-containing protein n=1 Tax=Marasmius tenuissimus TaxID=585030 RepID=A0ABR3A7H8_9AGAR
MDKALECFSNQEYNDVVLPDSFIFSDMTSAVYGAFEVASSIDKDPKPPAYKVDRKDIKRVVTDFTHKNGMSYTNFTSYYRNVHAPKVNKLIKTTGLTMSSTTSTVPNPFVPMSGWDAVAQVDGPNFQYILDVSKAIVFFRNLAHCARIQTSKKSQFVRLIKQDIHKSVSTNAGYRVIPCDTVSFQIPK